MQNKFFFVDNYHNTFSSLVVIKLFLEMLNIKNYPHVENFKNYEGNFFSKIDGNLGTICDCKTCF